MEQQSTRDSAQETQTIVLRRLLHLARIALVVTSVGTALLILQQFGGFGVTIVHSIKPDRIKKADEIYKWQLPEDYRSQLLNLNSSLLEDGVPFLNRSHSARELPKMGAGWFHVFRGNIKFMPTDGSDPRSSKHRYTVRTPLQFEPELWWWMGGLIAALLLVINWLRRGNPDEEPAPRWRGEQVWPVLGIFIVALVVTISHMASHRDHGDGIFVLKGIQESDAGGWHAMGLGLQRGQGLTTAFESQRPLYSVLLAFVYSITQPTVFVGQLFNGLLLAVACAALWWLGQILQRRWLGIGLAAVVLAGGLNLAYAHGLLTENAGLPLAILALISAWQAAWLLSPKGSFVAGAINGIAAMASGVTLFTLPIYAIWILANSFMRRAPWRRVILICVLYTVGATAVILPWMCRQQAKHGHFTISFNTAEVLAGGASPTEGHLDAVMLRDAAAHGVDLDNCEQRFQWFIDQYKALVAEDPIGYMQRVLHAANESLKSLPDSASAVPAILLIAMMGAVIHRTLRTGRITLFVIACAVVVLWIRAEAEIEPPVLLAAAYLAFRRARHPSERLAVGLLIGTVLATLFISGISGNIAPKRFWIATDWSVFALVSLGSWALIEMVSDLATAGLRAAGAPNWVLGGGSPPVSATVEGPRFLGGTLTAVLVVCGLAVGTCMGLTWRGPRPAGPTAVDFDTQTIAPRLIATHPEDRFQKTAPDLFQLRVMMLREPPVHLAEGEGFQHWMPTYNSRDYKRWICRFSLLDEHGILHSEISLLGRGSLATVPKNVPLLCIYLNLVEQNKISGEPTGIPCLCLTAPLLQDPKTGKWNVDETAIQHFPAPPDLLRSLPKGSAK
jgi:hypothetical protein